MLSLTSPPLTSTTPPERPHDDFEDEVIEDDDGDDDGTKLDPTAIEMEPPTDDSHVSDLLLPLLIEIDPDDPDTVDPLDIVTPSSDCIRNRDSDPNESDPPDHDDSDGDDDDSCGGSSESDIPDISHIEDDFSPSPPNIEIDPTDDDTDFPTPTSTEPTCTSMSPDRPCIVSPVRISKDPDLDPDRDVDTAMEPLDPIILDPPNSRNED